MTSGIRNEHGRHEMVIPVVAFSWDTSGLPRASAPGSLFVNDGDSMDLAARPVRMDLGVTVRGYQVNRDDT
ncbi:MAG TPA: hypothetical protein VF115_00900 [Acidimicrobiia bacterium]